MNTYSRNAIVSALAVCSLLLCGCKDAPHETPTTAAPASTSKIDSKPKDFSFSMPNLDPSNWKDIQLFSYPEGTQDLRLVGKDGNKKFELVLRAKNEGRNKISYDGPANITWSEYNKDIEVTGYKGNVREIHIKNSPPDFKEEVVLSNKDGLLSLRSNPTETPLPARHYIKFQESSRKTMEGWRAALEAVVANYNAIDDWKQKSVVPFHEGKEVRTLMHDFRRLNDAWKEYGKDYACWFGGFADSGRLLNAFVKELASQDLTNFTVSRNPKTNAVYVNWSDRIKDTELRINMVKNQCGLNASYYVSGWTNDYVKTLISYEYHYCSEPNSVRVPRVLWVDFFALNSKDEHKIGLDSADKYMKIASQVRKNRADRIDNLQLIKENCDDGKMKFNRVLTPAHFKLLDSSLQKVIDSWDKWQPQKNRPATEGETLGRASPINKAGNAAYFAHYG